MTLMEVEKKEHLNHEHKIVIFCAWSQDDKYHARPVPAMNGYHSNIVSCLVMLYPLANRISSWYHSLYLLVLVSLSCTPNSNASPHPTPSCNERLCSIHNLYLPILHADAIPSRRTCSSQRGGISQVPCLASSSIQESAVEGRVAEELIAGRRIGYGVVRLQDTFPATLHSINIAAV